MTRSLRSLLATGTIAVALVATASTVSYSAGARSVLLGKANSSAAGTTLTRTGAGPALTLKTRPTAPPLSVTSSKKVARLNADLLDGLDASTLEPTVQSFVTDDSTTQFTAVNYFLPLPAGTFRVDVNASLVGLDGATIGFCGISLGAGFIGGNSAPFVGGFRANVSMSKVITKAAGDLRVNCQVDTGLFTYFGSTPLSVSVTPVRSSTTTVIAPS